MNKRAPTYFGAELLRRTQEAALKEWNEKPQVPHWDRDEQMVFRVVRWRRVGPPYYFRPSAVAAGNLGAFWPEFEKWAAKQSRRSLARDTDEVVADFCNRLIAELKSPWLRRVEETLEGIKRERLFQLDSDAKEPPRVKFKLLT